MMRKKSMPTTLSVALVLLCMVLVTAHFTTGMYARYTTKSRGDDSGRIASFKVSATSAQTGPVTIGASKEGTYTLTVTNPGETAVRYKAEVKFASADDAAKFGEIAPLTGTLAPGGANETKTLTLKMSESVTGAGTVPFTVVVTFTQID